MDYLDEAMSQNLDKFCEQRRVIEVTETSSHDWKLLRTVEQDSVEEDKTDLRSENSERSEVIEVPKISCQEAEDISVQDSIARACSSVSLVSKLLRSALFCTRFGLVQDVGVFVLFLISLFALC